VSPDVQRWQVVATALTVSLSHSVIVLSLSFGILLQELIKDNVFESCKISRARVKKVSRYTVLNTCIKNGTLHSKVLQKH